MWIILSLAASAFFASATILDRYLSGEAFKNHGALLFYTSVANIVFLPLLWIEGSPGLLPVRLIPYIILMGAMEFGYYWLYYEALKHEDTSIVSSLFSIGKVFIPLGAFFILSERLLPGQYVGFFMIIGACALLSMKSFRVREFSHALRYMIPCSILISLQTIIVKYMTNFVDWETVFFWGMVSCMVVALGILFSRTSRQAISMGLSKKGLLVFGAEEFFAFFAAGTSTMAISLTDPTKVSALTSLSPVFVLLYGYIGSRWKPHLFRENIEKNQVAKKVVLFIIIAIGAYFVGS